MTSPLPLAGWYPDPVVPGAQRYFDGIAWTPHFVPAPPLPPRMVAPPPSVVGRPQIPPPPWSVPGPMEPGPIGTAPWAWGQPAWKGAHYGLPAYGPGSLATPGRRLGARVLDTLVLAPVLIALLVVAVLATNPHAGALVDRVPGGTATGGAGGGFVWAGLAVSGYLVVAAVLFILYEAVATAVWGRTIGKAWLRIRPVRADGAALGGGQAVGRVLAYWAVWLFGWFGLLDPMWCLWDPNSQCLHDKVAGTLVVNDPVVTSATLPDLRAGPTAIRPR